MPTLPDPRQEAFARALPMGRPSGAARAKAGYTRGWKNTRARAEMPAIAARVTELREDLQGGEISDVAPVITALMRLAKKAGDMSTPAAMAAARGLLAEAAKLKGRLEDKGERPDIVPEDVSRYLPLSDEDWMAKYGRLGQPGVAG